MLMIQSQRSDGAQFLVDSRTIFKGARKINQRMFLIVLKIKEKSTRMGLLLDFFFFAVCFAGDDFLLEDLLELLRRLAVELLVDFRADLEAGFRVDLL